MASEPKNFSIKKLKYAREYTPAHQSQIFWLLIVSVVAALITLTHKENPETSRSLSSPLPHELQSELHIPAENPTGSKELQFN